MLFLRGVEDSVEVNTSREELHLFFQYLLLHKNIRDRGAAFGRLHRNSRAQKKLHCVTVDLSEATLSEATPQRGEPLHGKGLANINTLEATFLHIEHAVI
jgi:hypothetical protein